MRRRTDGGAAGGLQRRNQWNPVRRIQRRNVVAGAFVDGAVVGSTIFDVSQRRRPWPNVCTFTTAAQLKALDPQITGLRGKPVGTKSNIIGAGGGSTPFRTDCKFNLTTKFDNADTAGNPSWVDISLSIVDTTAPEVFKQDETSTSVRKFAGLPGGASCYADTGNLLTCLSGNIVYNINGTKDTGGANFQADQEKWLTEIDLPLAKKLATELSSS